MEVNVARLSLWDFWLTTVILSVLAKLIEYFMLLEPWVSHLQVFNRYKEKTIENMLNKKKTNENMRNNKNKAEISSELRS